jgi:hypothetical protein
MFAFVFEIATLTTIRYYFHCGHKIDKLPLF